MSRSRDHRSVDDARTLAPKQGVSGALNLGGIKYE